MPGATDGLNLLQGYSGGAYSGFEYVSAATEDDLAIDRGLLFLMAFWSGPAVVGFKNICESLSSIDLPENFTFRVLDWDGATQFLEQLSKYDVIIGGNAEAFWYREGEIFAATHAGTATPMRVAELIAKLTDL